MTSLLVSFMSVRLLTHICKCKRGRQIRKSKLFQTQCKKPAYCDRLAGLRAVGYAAVHTVRGEGTALSYPAYDSAVTCDSNQGTLDHGLTSVQSRRICLLRVILAAQDVCGPDGFLELLTYGKSDLATAVVTAVNRCCLETYGCRNAFSFL